MTWKRDMRGKKNRDMLKRKRKAKPDEWKAPGSRPS